MDTSVPKLEPAQDDPGRLGHGGPHGGHVLFQAIERGADQEGVVHRGADLDAALGCQAGGQAASFRRRWLAWGNSASDRGLAFSPTCTCHPKTVCSEPVSMAVSSGRV